MCDDPSRQELSHTILLDYASAVRGTPAVRFFDPRYAHLLASVHPGGTILRGLLWRSGLRTCFEDHNMTICGLSLHHGNTESRKSLEQKLIFQLGTLSPHGINERLSLR